MKIIFKPENRQEALNWLLSLSIYSVSDFLKVRSLEFEPQDITEVYRAVEPHKFNVIHFKLGELFGSFECTTLPEGILVPIKSFDARAYVLKQVWSRFWPLRRFYESSPLITVFCSVLLSTLAWSPLWSVILRHLIHPEHFVNAVCNQKCVDEIMCGYSLLTYLGFTVVVAIASCSLRSMSILKKQKNVYNRRLVQCETIFLSSILLASIVVGGMPYDGSFIAALRKADHKLHGEVVERNVSSKSEAPVQ